MNDQTTPTDDDRRIAREWAEGIEANPKSWSLRTRTAARVILDAVPALSPSSPTMADMTYEERAACQWMQCDVIGFRGKYALISPSDRDGDAVLLGREGEVHYEDHAMVVPRPDLPRFVWPGEQQSDPAPVPEPIANMREEWGVKWDDDPHGPPDSGLATRAAAEKWEKETRHYGPKRGRIVRRQVGPWKEA